MSSPAATVATYQMNREEAIKSVVANMYKDGEDHRAVKGGHGAVLIKTVTHYSQFSCVGVFRYLPTNFKALIDNKALFTRMSEEDKKVVFEFLLRHRNTFNPELFCISMNKRAITALDDYVHGREVEKSDTFMLDLRKWFVDQDRKKCTAGSQKAGSSFIYDETKHAAETANLKSMTLIGCKPLA